VLRALRPRTGLGAVLNTSFNIHGQPVACTPEDAIRIWAESTADALAIGPFLLCR
jgi:carbamoyltransferase